MRNQPGGLSSVVFAAAIVLLLTACQHQELAMPALEATATPDSSGSGMTAVPAGPSSSPNSTGAAPSGSPDSSTAAAHPEKTTQSLDNGVPNAAASPAPDSGKPAGKPNAAVPGASMKPYSSQAPALMGLSLQMAKDKVTALYGKPSQQYKLEDETEPLTILDYGSFSAGFDAASRLVFVDLSSADVDPGLNGLHLGQTSDDAIAVLGKPETQSGYVLAYKTKTTVLKLDIDPKTKEIRSIKLFARTD